eukprot:m.104958 g.104958  ORF g.104958 m.104958 type:complete len:415 (-) comp10544_c0_seq2:1640-2884(-)
MHACAMFDVCVRACVRSRMHPTCPASCHVFVHGRILCRSPEVVGINKSFDAFLQHLRGGLKAGCQHLGRFNHELIVAEGAAVFHHPHNRRLHQQTAIFIHPILRDSAFGWAFFRDPLGNLELGHFGRKVNIHTKRVLLNNLWNGPSCGGDVRTVPHAHIHSATYIHVSAQALSMHTEETLATECDLIHTSAMHTPSQRILTSAPTHTPPPPPPHCRDHHHTSLDHHATWRQPQREREKKGCSVHRTSAVSGSVVLISTRCLPADIDCRARTTATSSNSVRASMSVTEMGPSVSLNRSSRTPCKVDTDSSLLPLGNRAWSVMVPSVVCHVSLRPVCLVRYHSSYTLAAACRTGGKMQGFVVWVGHMPVVNTRTSKSSFPIFFVTPALPPRDSENAFMLSSEIWISLNICSNRLVN